MFKAEKKIETHKTGSHTWNFLLVLRVDPSLGRRLETSVSLCQPELPSNPMTVWNVLCEKEDPRGYITGSYTVQVHSLSCFCGLCSSLQVQQEEGHVITIFSKYWWPQDKCHPSVHSAEKTRQTYAPGLFPISCWPFKMWNTWNNPNLQEVSSWFVLLLRKQVCSFLLM